MKKRKVAVLIHDCPLPEVILKPHEDECRKFPVWEVLEDAQCKIKFSILGLPEKNVPGYVDSIVEVPIPKGFLTDLGSVPKFSLIQPVRFPRPAVLHDYAYRYMAAMGEVAWGNKQECLEDPSLKWFFDPANNYENQKRFFDTVLYEQCRRHCKSLSRSAPRRIYWAVRMFGGSSFNNDDSRKKMEKIAEKIRSKPEHISPDKSEILKN